MAGRAQKRDFYLAFNTASRHPPAPFASASLHLFSASLFFLYSLFFIPFSFAWPGFFVCDGSGGAGAFCSHVSFKRSTDNALGWFGRSATVALR